MRVIAIVSTWTKFAFTIRACRSKQQIILCVAAVLLTSIPPAPSSSQYSGIIPQIDDSMSLVCFALFKIWAWTARLFVDRKKLSELDNIQRYFSRKLSTPTFPPLSEQDCHTRQEERRDTDTCQLLLKSNQLVGEVNSIITGELFVLLKNILLMGLYYKPNIRQ